MKKYIEINIAQSLVTSITCDVCKKTYLREYEPDIMEWQEMTLIKFTGGYGSVFGDGDTFELDICQHCLKAKLGQYFRTVDSIWVSE